MTPSGSFPHPPTAVLAIVGPTGSGKSELGLFLAQRLGGEIVNCDSVQVYRELNIGSAKLPLSERRGIPHHLLDAASFRDELTAGAYARLGRQAISEIIDRGRVPIVVGGSGLYLRALFEGLSPAPLRDPAVRIRLTGMESRRPGALHRYLRKVDPPSAARIHPRDAQKLIRAVEICLAGQMPASLAQSEPRIAFTGVDTLKIGLNPDRQRLRERLSARTEAMFRDGLVDEARLLLEAAGPEPLPKSLGALGYKQAVDVLLGRSSVADAIENTRIKTCQYAKRQMTWFRADKTVRWISDFGSAVESQRTALEWCTEFCSALPYRSFRFSDKP